MSIRTFATGTLLQPLEVVPGKIWEWDFGIAESREGPRESLSDVVSAEMVILWSGHEVTWSMASGEIAIEDDAFVFCVPIDETSPLGLWPWLFSVGFDADEPPTHPLLRGKFDSRGVA